MAENFTPLQKFILELTKGRPLRPAEIQALLKINGLQATSRSYIVQVRQQFGKKGAKSIKTK